MSSDTTSTEELKLNKRKKGMSQRVKNMISGYLFISPFYLLFIVFGLFPIIFSFYLAFFQWDGLGDMTFVAFNNFSIIFNDPLFWKSIYNTIIIGLMGTAPQLLVGLLLAYALNSALLRYTGLFRVAIFLPYVTSIVAVAIVFSVIFSNNDGGLVNSFLALFGVEPITWSRSEWGTKVAIATMIFWRWVGYNTIIYLAGMQSIPNDLYEAAKMDGATVMQQIRHITIPMLKPFIFFTVFTSTIGALQVFAEPQIFQGRGGRPEGISIVLYLYREAFVSNYFGTASAVAIVLFFIIVILAVANLLLANRIGQSPRRGL